MKVKASAIRKVGSAMKVSISRASRRSAGKGHEGEDQRQNEAQREAARAGREGDFHGVQDGARGTWRWRRPPAKVASENPPAAPVKAWPTIRDRG